MAWTQNLEEAVAERRHCRLSQPGQQWLDAVLVRLDAAGLVCSVPGHDLRGGEEVRVALDDCYFEASVLRVGVPVPDRGSYGIMLGFLEEMEPSVRPPQAVAEILLAGERLSLLDPPIRLVEVNGLRIDFEVPMSFTVVFPLQGHLRLRVGADGSSVCEVAARVERVIRGEERLLYVLALEGVDNAEYFQRAITILSNAPRSGAGA